MQRLTSIFHLGIKELRSLYRDPVMFVFIIFAFTVMIYVAGKGGSMELNNAPIAVVDQDRSPLSQRIIRAFYEPSFKTPEVIEVNEIDRSMDAGNYTFVLDIPPDFQRDLLAGKRPEIQLNVDATQMSQAFIGAGYIQNITQGEIIEFMQGNRADLATPIALITRMRFNPTLTSSWFGGVMELINIINLLSIILAGAALIREREHGTLEHLLVMPLTPLDIMLSKVWSMGLVVLIAAGLSLHFMIAGILEMPIAGSVPLFLLGTTIFLFSSTSLGILLGTIARTMPQLGLLMILIIIPLQLLSGGSTPYESMPEFVQFAMQFAPTSHFVRIAQAILYRGAGLEVLWPDLLANIVIGMVFFLVALALFRKSLVAAR